MMGGGATRNM